MQTGHAARGQDGAAAAASEPHRAHSLACTHCRDQPPVWRRSVCAEDYAFPWNILIGDFKFRADVALAGLLARRLATVIQGMGAHTDVDLVLPVPLSAARLQQRGFNQAWELARRVARHVGLPAEAQLLQRPIETLHQVELSVQERALNLCGAFMVDPNARARLADRRVALVDDVMTTGATCREAARALLQAGASCVDVWAVARTP